MERLDINKVNEDTYIIRKSKPWEEFNTYYLSKNRYYLIVDCEIGIYQINDLSKKSQENAL